MSSSGKSHALRVLLVTSSDEEVRSFGLALHRERIATTRVPDATAALAALQTQGFDVVVLSHPLPDADVIASCAALSQVPAAPPLILLDSLDPNGQTFPGSIRPARMLQKPIDAAKLAELVREVVENPDAAPDATPGAVTAPFALASTLLELAASRETGVLDVTSEAAHTRIFLQSGAPVSAEGGSLRETLGRMLLRRGALNEADYVRVIERMTEKVMANEHQRMGEVLVQLGLLSGDEVRRALEAQLFEKVTACFQCSSATISFSELDLLPEELEPFHLPPVERLVYEGLRRQTRPEALEAWLAPHASARPRLKRPVDALGELLALDAPALRSLEGVAGKRSVAALLKDDAEAPALLTTLLLIDALDLGAHAREKVRPPEGGRGAFAREVVGKRKATATPLPASAAQKRLEGEQCYRRAQGRIAAGRPSEALALLRKAVQLEPGEPEYAMLEAWVSYLEARHAVRVARARATGASARVLEADPRAPRVHTILGRLALDEGDRARATREFELALLRDPSDEEAKRGLQQARG